MPTIVGIAQIAKSIVEPDGVGYWPAESVTGKEIRHYSYDQFDEVSVTKYENGCLLRNLGHPYEWYGKAKMQACFDKAKILGRRSRGLNWMMR